MAQWPCTLGTATCRDLSAHGQWHTRLASTATDACDPAEALEWSEAFLEYFCWADARLGPA